MKSTLNHQLSTLNHLLVLCGLLLGALPSGRAATNTVLNLNDSGPGSLRQAIAEAAPADTIDFAVTGTITLTSGQLVISNNLTISGPGRTNLTVSGNNASRVISFNNVTATISDLTIANGRTSTGNGGGINSSGGSLVVSNCSVSNNYAVSGGGISQIYGALHLISSAVFQNTSMYFGGGGGIHLYYSTLAVTNSTVSQNVSGLGGGIYAQSCTNVIVSSTICSNIATSSQSGGIHLPYSELFMANTLVSGNKAYPWPDGGGGHLNSGDYNLIGNTNGFFITGVTTHNIYGKDPLLGPLADNGGPTPTHALLPGSPAIDQGSSGGLATGQRGQPRPFNFPAYFNAADGSDIGAYELQERAQTGPGFTVNTTDDAADGVPGIAHCSLREALAAANANADTNTIDFAVAVPGLHTGVTGTITLTNGQLTIMNSVNIDGPGVANLTVGGNNASQVFRVTNGNVTISDLTVADGAIPSTAVGPFGGPETVGAGIYNSATLMLNKCVVTRNTNNLPAAGPSGYGGGIGNMGMLTVASTIISRNFSQRGGGIQNHVYVGGPSSLRLLNSAVIENKAAVGGGGLSVGGSATITNTTFSRNQGGGLSVQGDTVLWNSTVASNSGAGISVGDAALHIRSSIVAGNSGPDCQGPIISEDYNLIHNPSGAGITGVTTHNIYNQDPKLGPLADLGGPTPTHALRFDSPALDAGHSGGLTTDQRGLPRPIDDPNTPNAAGGDSSDIGAYEADPNLRLLAPEKIGGDIRLRFNTLFGRTYQVESKDEITGPWNVLSNNITGDGSSVQAVDTGAANLPRRFYRGVLLLP